MNVCSFFTAACCPHCQCSAVQTISRQTPFLRQSAARLRSRQNLIQASTDDTRSVISDENIKRPSPLKGTKLKRVERLGQESWAGVAAVDRGETSHLGRLALLVGGDTLALLLFAAIGRRNHGEGLQLLQTLNTAVPFLVGWTIAANLTGAYSGSARSSPSVGSAAVTAIKAWILAVPAALVLRSVQRGYIPDKSFVLVSFIATGVLLIGWRSALAAASKKSGSGQNAQNKQGNPLEFLQLLTSLTKRW